MEISVCCSWAAVHMKVLSKYNNFISYSMSVVMLNKAKVSGKLMAYYPLTQLQM